MSKENKWMDFKIEEISKETFISYCKEVEEYHNTGSLPNPSHINWVIGEWFEGFKTGGISKISYFIRLVETEAVRRISKKLI